MFDKSIEPHTPHRNVRRLGPRAGLGGFVVVLIALLVPAAPAAVTRPRTRRLAPFIGAQAWDWGQANSRIGPLGSDKLFYGPTEPLPTRWPRGSYGLPRRALAIIAYKVPTKHVLSFVRSIPRGRPVTMVFWQEPESHMTASHFLPEFERQSRLIRSAHRSNVKVAFDANIWRYQRQYPGSYNCQYVPPPKYVDYYYGDAYEFNDETLEAQPQFRRWAHCTSHRDRRRGLAEYGLSDCQGDAHRARTLIIDIAYLRRNFPGLRVLSYWWDDTSPNAGMNCHTDWQFTGPKTVGAWRALETGRLGLRR